VAQAATPQQAAAAEPLDVSAVQVADQVRRGQLSAADLTAAYLARIARFEPEFNSFRTIDADRALARAREIDGAVARGEDPGPLAGVPIALKDNIAIAGVRMSAASGFRREVAPETEDAPVTAALKRAGAVLLGSLHMSEWAIGGTTQNIHFGYGHNAWDRDRVPGGSSGGSGAAAAAGLALVTIGTDTGGSIRLPGSLNGVVGLRPTHGRVSNRASIPVAWSFDTIGPLARRAEDVALVLGAIAGYDAGDPASIDVPVDDYVAAVGSGVDGLRVGVLGGSFRAAPLADGVRVRLNEAERALGGLGVTLQEATLDGLDQGIELTADLLLAEAAAFHADRMASNPDGFAKDVQTRLRRGQGVTGPAYGAGRQEQREWRRKVVELLDAHDVLLSPACPIPAPLAAESDPLPMTAVLAHFTGVWVLAGVPALVVPIGFVDGMPVAMQLIGRHFDEGRLLALAHAYQQVTDWHLQRPPDAPAAG
jgi:aspartyl-tRNA(Asn)/glutamyl-tRNA(Gln) amidotransferase subunit A